MKKTDIKQLHSKTEEELKVILKDTVDALNKAKMDLVAHKLKNTTKLRELKDDIARILTIMNKEDNAKNSDR